MSRGSLLALPALLGCLAGEMLYVLNQRLAAQEVVDAKSWLFFGDILRALFDADFLAQIFTPQKIYPLDALKMILLKSVKSGVVKMTTASFDKLFDLSLMQVKSQFSRCAGGEEIVQVTFNHIFELRKISANQETKLLDRFVVQFEAATKIFTFSDFLKMRQILLTFLSPARARVTSLISDDLQSDDGCLIIRRSGYLAPGTLSPPGTLKAGNKSVTLFPASSQWWVLPPQFSNRQPFFHILYSRLGLASQPLKPMRYEPAPLIPAAPAAVLVQDLPTAPIFVAPPPPAPPAEPSAPLLKEELSAFAAALRKTRAPKKLSRAASEWILEEEVPEGEARPGKMSGSDILGLMDSLK